jgi:hypothetical protein
VLSVFASVFNGAIVGRANFYFFTSPLRTIATFVLGLLELARGHVLVVHVAHAFVSKINAESSGDQVFIKSHKVSLRLGFPVDVIERWFPRLYPIY